MKNNILFYKEEELDLMIKITNKTGTKITLDDVKQMMSKFITPQDRLDKTVEFNFNYILMLFGSTTQCNMKGIKSKELDDFHIDLNFTDEYLNKLKLIPEEKQKFNSLKSIYEEYITQVKQFKHYI